MVDIYILCYVYSLQLQYVVSVKLQVFDQKTNRFGLGALSRQTYLDTHSPVIAYQPAKLCTIALVNNELLPYGVTYLYI